MQKKIITNEERHFSIDAIANRAIAREERKVVSTGTLLNWLVPHRLSKYHNPMSNQPNNFYWIQNGEDYYIAVERIKEERQKDESFFIWV